MGEFRMNEVLQQLKERKSVRVFQDKIISDSVKKEILQAALTAPSAGAMMLYTILDISDQNIKDRLAVLCDHQPFIGKAPLVLVFLADYQRWFDCFTHYECNPRTPGEGDLLLACADAIIAAQNSVVAAHSLGLGSCYIGDIIEQYEEVRDLLNLPEYVVPAAMVVYGYPEKQQLERRKPERYELSYIVQENQYKRLTSEEHQQMQETRYEKSNLPERSMKDYIQAFCQRKYMSDFSLEMSRSAREYMKHFQG